MNVKKEPNPPNNDDGKPQTPVSRLISFLLLVAIVAILGVVFFKVMARFIVPLFLSALLVVMFRPLHDWMLEKVKGREWIAAALTTSSILLLVLIPVSSLVFLAATEGYAVVRQINPQKTIDDLSDTRKKLNLDMEHAREIRAIEEALESLQNFKILGQEELNEHDTLFLEIMGDANNIAAEPGILKWPVPVDEENEAPKRRDNMVSYWQNFGHQIGLAKKHQEEIKDIIARDDADDPQTLAQITVDRRVAIDQYVKTLAEASTHFLDFKYAKFGGRTWSTVVELANPSRTQLQQYSEGFVGFLRDKLFALGGSITSFIGNSIFGLFIMVVGLYFFLLDGPGMLTSLQGLSPIEDKHEQELVAEFARVSRAVVVATLLSAAAQGVLAGIGFYFAGLESVFLLTLLSGVLAMVPFVGAASVWIPCVLYLYFVDNNLVAALGLAAYGGLVISMADNFIKPWILHGQSNLHPLLALLSVIGGVTVLGPIGILVGPMIVVFLQTLLKIIQREMHLMEGPAAAAAETVTVIESDELAIDND